MKIKKHYICLGGAIGLAATLSGCGAPDLNTLEPQVKKPACVVVIVGKPNFVSQSAVLNMPSDQGMLFNAVGATTTSFASVATQDLANQDVTSCVIAVDNGQALANQISQLEQRYKQIHFSVVSNQPMGIPSLPNGASLTQDAPSQAFVVGWLAGSWALNQMHNVASGVQPVFGYDGTGIATSQVQAFFAGLYTIDPAAVVRSLTSGSKSAAGNPAGAGTTVPYASSVPIGGLILGAQPSPVVSSILSQMPTVFALHSLGGGIQPAVQPGQLDAAHFDQELHQIATGQWQAGDETVVDASSIFVNTQLLPASVVNAWTSLQKNLTVNLWQQDYQKLPQPVKQSFQSQFGIA